MTFRRQDLVARTLVRLTVLLGLLAMVAPPLGAQEKLSREERRIADWVRTHREEAVATLERIVNINSGTMNAAGVRAVGDALRPAFDSLGFTTRWVTVPDSMRRAGHLFAERRGARGKRLLLIGHLDTVFEEDSPFQRFERRGTIAAGPGVTDMKGGDVVILYALKALASIGALRNTTITAAFTGDEENPGEPLSEARAPLVEAAQRSDIALEFEATAGDSTQEYATIARRSASSWVLRTRGKIAHSSGIFRESSGAGAIYEAARILDRFYTELRGEEYLTFNPGVILGGTDVAFDQQAMRGTAMGKDNVIAQTAVVGGDLRTISDEQLARARDRMRRIVAASLPQTSAQIAFVEGYPAMAPTAGNRALLERMNAINRALGYRSMEALDPGLRGAADISFVAQYVDGLAGLGASGSGSHTPDETVDLEQLPVQITRAALLIYRLTR